MKRATNVKHSNNIDYVLHIYDIYWDYYKQTLNERTHILNNYIIFVGVPISIMSIMIEKMKNDIELYLTGIIFLLMLILLLGIVIYYSYIVESIVSNKYLNRIEIITKYLIENYDIYTKGIFKELYCLDGLFQTATTDRNIRLSKGIIVPIINSGILSGTIYLVLRNCEYNWFVTISIFFVSIYIHILVFDYMRMKNGFK